MALGSFAPSMVELVNGQWSGTMERLWRSVVLRDEFDW